MFSTAVLYGIAILAIGGGVALWYFRDKIFGGSIDGGFPVQPTPVPASGFPESDNTNLGGGGDFSITKKDSSQACAKACHDEPKCAAWAWTKPTSGNVAYRSNCWLKAQVPIPSPQADTVSGLRA
jgi:hypothetical protein